MPLRDDLLNPVPGDNPSGVSLRYDRIYDQIKEARTEDDDSIPSGEWQRTVKKADFALVIKLAGEALSAKSKDLQLAAWLTEAHVKREGIGLIQPCFKLMQDLQEQFWEGLYPEIEDGDVGMRAVPIEWAANRIAVILREAPITRDGLSYYEYKDSRTIGYEADVGYNDAKREAREQALKDGKLTAEDFDKAVASTLKTFYVNLYESMHAAAETVDALQIFCEEKYGDDGPAFGKLRTSLEEVGQVVGSLLNEKRKLEPDQDGVDEEAEPEPEAMAAVEPVAEAAPSAKVKKGKAVSAEPVDWDDAIGRIQACAQFLQKERSSSPVPYLLQTSVRLGEMREQGSYASYDFLVSPPTETRQNLKRLSSESNWEELLSVAVAAAGEPCGRAWLDVHRYVWKASYEAGYSAISASVIATLQSLLKDIPDLPTWTLNDDTPTANPETQRWLEEMVIPKPPEPIVREAVPPPEPEPIYAAAHEPDEPGEDAPPDILDIAKDMIRRGQLPQAIQLLVRDAAQQPSGRARFLRRLQVAQLCVSAGQSKVAHPVLEELVKEIDQRRLEEWEASDMITPPMALLLKCLDPSNSNGAREALFAKLCRIDPSFAMDVSH